MNAANAFRNCWRNAIFAGALFILAIDISGTANARTVEKPLELVAGSYSPRMPSRGPIDAAGVQQAHYRGYCAHWFRVCRRRWGVGTWRFRRCLAIRGCY